MRPHERLEADWAKFCGSTPDRVVCCSSGTAALHLALEALRLPPGSGVVVPDFTMIACARAVALAGLTPVFCDVLRDRLTLDPGLIEDSICAGYSMGGGRGVRAVMPVAVYGRAVDPGVWDVAAKYGLAVVEDLAEAHGVPPHPDSAAACWSFYRNKIIAGEEGGAVLFRDKEPAGLARSLRSLGFTPEHDYTHVPRGHNYRLADTLASLVGHSLAAYTRYPVTPTTTGPARRRVEDWYDARCPVGWRQPARDAVWVYDVRVPGLTRDRQDAAVRSLRAAGVEARHGFKPLSGQEEFRGCRKAGGAEAEAASREVIYLPITPATTEGDVDRAVTLLTAELADLI